MRVAAAVAPAGSLDGKIRVWSILDSSVIATVQLHQDMVTAVSFSLNGSRVMAGTMRGRVRFYDLADGKLEYVAQVGGWGGRSWFSAVVCCACCQLVMNALQGCTSLHSSTAWLLAVVV